MVLTKLKKAGYSFSTKSWPYISATELNDLGIDPSELHKAFKSASLDNTPIGTRPRIGFYLGKPGQARNVCLR